MEHRDLILIGVFVVILISAILFFNIDSNITGYSVTNTASLGISATIGTSETKPTPTGSDVQVDFPLNDITVTYDCVITPGDTSVLGTTASSKPNPANFRSLGKFWEITTTVGYTCPAPAETWITVCASGFDVKPGFKFFHWENVPPERWVDRTILVDTVADIICAKVPYLSPFGIFGPIEPTPAEPTKWSGGGGSGYDPRYASAKTVYDAQTETEQIVKEPEERPKVQIKEKIKEIIEEFKAPEEAEPAVEPEVKPEPKPVVQEEPAPMILLVSIAFALIIIGLVIVFFKVEK
ncbi:hypothetical protein KY336_04905 [Candidatus Woesearchaeota archaeon]|nr:hypothetical protein [Candidatus Woesearchaeota archaeon]